MNKASNIIQKLSAAILLLITLWLSVVSWLNYSFVSQWRGDATELAEKNVSLMTVFSTNYWPFTILLCVSCAVTAFYLFKKNTMPIVFNISLVLAFSVSGALIHVMAVSTGFELHAITK